MKILGGESEKVAKSFLVMIVRQGKYQLRKPILESIQILLKNRVINKSLGFRMVRNGSDNYV